MEDGLYTIAVDLNVSNFEDALEIIHHDLNNVQKVIIGLAAVANKAFTNIAQNIYTISVNVQNLVGTLSTMTEKWNEIAVLEHPAAQWSNNVAVISDVCTILQTLITIISLETDATTLCTLAKWAQIGATTAWNAICVVATAVTNAFGAAISFLTSPIGLVLVAVAALIAIVVLLISNWDTVKEVAVKVWQDIVDVWNKVSVWFDENVIQPVAQFFSDMWSKISGFASNAWNGIASAFTVVAAWFDTNVIQPLLQFFSNMWSKISGFATSAWNGIVSVFQGVAAWFDKYVVQPIQKIITGIQAGFKNMVNGVIGFINGMISGIIKGINAVIGALNKLQFTVPDWVPGLGGQTLGFNLKTLTAPQIPYLAKGAVLPANKPFLAVVGDQKHGTNIEAPLTTIETAVANVLSHQFGGVMAGFNALLEEQRAIRRTIEQIEIGDNVIGQAAERYAQKMAIVYGGY